MRQSTVSCQHSLFAQLVGFETLHSWADGKYHIPRTYAMKLLMHLSKWKCAYAGPTPRFSTKTCYLRVCLPSHCIPSDIDHIFHIYLQSSRTDRHGNPLTAYFCLSVPLLPLSLFFIAFFLTMNHFTLLAVIVGVFLDRVNCQSSAQLVSSSISIPAQTLVTSTLTMTGLNGQTSTLIDVIGPGGPSSGTILTGGTSLQTPSHTTLLPSSHPRGSTVSVSNSAIATAQSSNTQSTDQPVLSSTLSSSLTGQSSNPLTNTTILPSSSTGVSSPQTSITTSPASGAQSTTLPVSPGSSIPSASSGSSGTAQTPSSQTPGQSTSSGIFSSSITPGPTTTKPSSAPGSTSTGPGGWTTSDIIVTATDGHTTGQMSPAFFYI